jgi:hypothetical protein
MGSWALIFALYCSGPTLHPPCKDAALPLLARCKSHPAQRCPPGRKARLLLEGGSPKMTAAGNAPAIPIGKALTPEPTQTKKWLMAGG